MMGKPLQQAKNEMPGMLARGKHLCKIAPKALAPDIIKDKGSRISPTRILVPRREIHKVPVGPVLVIAPWNYPLLTAINGVAAAVLAGNSVILKHSPRTPTIADYFQQAFIDAGAPEHLLQAYHASNEMTAELIQNEAVQFVAFTGSVGGGHAIYEQAAKRFIDVGLELGGKDPAYVAEDADFQSSVEGIVDGCFYNAGQSCCAVERVYVHEKHYQRFIEAASELIQSQYIMGDPLDPATTLGPLAQAQHPYFLNDQVTNAVAKGATVVCGGHHTTDAKGQGRFFAPTLLADCDHSMDVMQEESFGPIMAVQKVSGDEEALRLMNDCQFGLTASVWTTDESRAEKFFGQLQTGTVFMNRSDCPDPYLPWTGVKNTGKGHSLSRHAFDPMTRFKSMNFKRA